MTFYRKLVEIILTKTFNKSFSIGIKKRVTYVNTSYELHISESMVNYTCSERYLNENSMLLI